MNGATHEVGALAPDSVVVTLDPARTLADLIDALAEDRDAWRCFVELVCSQRDETPNHPLWEARLAELSKQLTGSELVGIAFERTLTREQAISLTDDLDDALSYLRGQHLQAHDDEPRLGADRD